MFAVIFEVQPKPEQWDAYLHIASGLRPILEGIDGFIDNERFRSLRTAGRVLSLSTWANEKALIRWRTVAQHHAAQKEGRSAVFEDYHLRVGEITDDTHMPEGHSLQQDRFDMTEVGRAKLLTVTEITSTPDQVAPADAGLGVGVGLPTDGGALIDHEVFESLSAPGKLLLLASWDHPATGRNWKPIEPGQRGYVLRHRQVRVVRDYGMFDRREAPQFYPAVQPFAGAPGA